MTPLDRGEPDKDPARQAGCCINRTTHTQRSLTCQPGTVKSM